MGGRIASCGTPAKLRRLSISDFVRTTLVLIGIPIASILVPALLTWARDLDAPSRRIRKLDEQSKIVAFWDGWLKTVTATKPADNRFHQKSEARIVAITREARHALADAGSSALLIYRLDEYRAYHVRRRDYRKYKLNFEEFQRYRKTLPWYRRALLLYKAPNPRLSVSRLHFTST